MVYQQGGFQPVVQVQFNDEGAKLFERITERNVGKQLAIFVGGEMVSQATVQQKIPGGTAVITGNFTPEVATKMARDLNTGALPTAIELVGQETIGSILGQEALVQSVKAGAIGVLILLLFMLFYYRYQGLVANIALGFYVVIMVALVKFFGITLTLAGIAALILSVGMAVDANVLIFSRLKEELAHGRDLTSTINTAFKRAWSSIFDSNVSSLITALILFWFGTGMIKGFAVVFSLGILVSVFSAVYVTRVILLLSARTAWGKKLIKW